jgi:hypothetical protein
VDNNIGSAKAQARSLSFRAGNKPDPRSTRNFKCKISNFKLGCFCNLQFVIRRACVCALQDSPLGRLIFTNQCSPQW